MTSPLPFIRGVPEPMADFAGPAPGKPTQSTRDAVRIADDATKNARASKPLNPNTKTVSPFYFNYLNDQAKAIRASGGGDADVEQFIKMEQQRPLEKLPVPSIADELEMPSHLRGVSMAVIQGATFGFGDEAVGAALGMLTGLGARRGIEEYRREYDAYAKQHGTISFVGELAGGLLSGGLAGGARAATVGSVARTGAAAGALAGIGYADGPTASWNISERLKGAALGGVIGGATAGVMGVLGKVVRPLTQGTIRAVTPQRIQTELGVTATERAYNKLLSAFEADGLTLDGAKAEAATWLARGVPVSLLELAPENGAVHALVSDALKWRSPTVTRTLANLQLRAGEQAERLNAMGAALFLQNKKLGLDNADDLLLRMHAQAKTQARPYYVEAYGQMVDVDDRMWAILDRPDFRKMWTRVVEKATKEDDALAGYIAQGMTAQEAGALANITPGLSIPALPDASINIAALRARFPGVTEAALERMAKAAGPQRPTQLPLRAFDMLKREADILVGESLKDNAEAQLSRSAFERAKAREGNALFHQLRQLIDPVRAQHQSYRNALAVYSEYGGVKDAMFLAKDFLRKSPEAVARDIAKLSPNERDFYRATVLQVKRDQIAKAVSAGRRDIAKRVFQGEGAFAGRSQDARRIRALFPDAPEAAEHFLRVIQGETIISEATRSALRNTRARVARQADDLIPARTSVLGETLGLARQAISRAGRGMAQEDANEIAHLVGLGLADPSMLYAQLEHFLGGTARRSAKRALPRTAIVRTLGQQVGQGAGSEVTDQ